MLTRCPSCKTIFRIEESHLEAAGGQVRCGRCKAVFDARWSLVPDGSFSPRSPSDARAADPWEAMPPFPDEHSPPAAPGEEGPDRQAAGIREEAQTPQAHPPDGTTVTRFMEVIAATGEKEVPHESLPPKEIEPPPLEAGDSGGDLAGISAPESGDRDQPPNRETKPAERGQEPQVALDEAACLFEDELDLPAPPSRWPWALGSLLLVITLAGQLLLLRPELPASWTPLRPLVESACQLLPCSLPRRLAPEALQVLARDMVEEDEAIRIHLSFVNTASFPQPWPLLEIVLSDARGTALAAGRFPPSVYLGEDGAVLGPLPPQRPAQANLRLERVPGAVSWQFRLLFPGRG